MGSAAQFRKLTAATTEYGTSDVDLCPRPENEGHRGKGRLARPVPGDMSVEKAGLPRIN